jgi:predicted Zn-dependent protease with MMP-like domain
LAFEIDLRELENDYSIMSPGEFALLRRSDLTPEAAEIYDRVAAIRRAGDDYALEVTLMSSDIPPQAKKPNSPIRSLPGSAALFANTLGFKIDLKELENDYSIMPAEEFALLRRSDLTPEALEIYDRVAAVRRAGDDSAFELPPVSSDTPGPNTARMREATGSETFEELVEWAYSTLPQSIKDLPDFPGIQAADEPPEGYLETRARRTELLGLFVGVHRTKRQFHYVPKTPDLIFVFRGPIVRCSKGDLRSEVKRVVWHEVAHWLGYGEKDVKELGL